MHEISLPRQPRPTRAHEPHVPRATRATCHPDSHAPTATHTTQHITHTRHGWHARMRHGTDYRHRQGIKPQRLELDGPTRNRRGPKGAPLEARASSLGRDQGVRASLDGLLDAPYYRPASRWMGPAWVCANWTDALLIGVESTQMSRRTGSKSHGDSTVFGFG